MRKGATFVLVHGAWHGGWCFARIRDRLLAAGHRVFTPTLTGLADRAHLLSRDVDLDTHINDVTNLLVWEELEDVVLVGHSYGAWVVSAAAERILSRLAAIVVLDGRVPADGERSLDYARPVSRRLTEDALQAGHVAVPPPPVIGWNLRAEADRRWVERLLTPQPLAVSLQAVAISGAVDRIPRKLYVHCTGYQDVLAPARRASIAAREGWAIHDVNCGHEIMIDEPDRLSRMLVEMAT